MSARVTAQEHRGRWAYVITTPGRDLYVSGHRYGSEQTALAAGRRDLASAEEQA